MSDDDQMWARYPVLAGMTDPLPPAGRAVMGREKEVQQVLASLSRPELCNVMLLASAGAGKTTLVQAVMAKDQDRIYLELDPARMLSKAGTPEHMAGLLKEVFDEARRFVENERRELVVFIDEFHLIVQLSDAAVEAIKPVLAASGMRGIRIIAATTNEEFHKHISSNLPLVERLQRINLESPDMKTTVSILRAMSERYGVSGQFPDDHLFNQIYDLTNQYKPASAQPRKSLQVLDSMIGWHRVTGKPMDRDLLAQVLEESMGVNMNLRVDGARIKQMLDERVLAQELATEAVHNRLQVCVADLNDPSRPRSSFLFAGPTGVGKTELTKQLAEVLFGDATNHLIRFDMSEFAEDSSMSTFRAELTRRVWDTPHSVILFDEIEKAAGKVTRLLLQVLDDGRLSDENGRQVSFLNSYIVMTTNAGSGIHKEIGEYERDSGTKGMDKYRKLIARALTETQEDNRFPPELINRVDAIVPFRRLELITQAQIVRRKLLEMVFSVATKHGVYVDVDDSVLRYLINDLGETDSDAGGARKAVARMNDEVVAEVAAFINAYPSCRRIRVDIVGEMASENKHRLISAAQVQVSADTR